MAQPILEMQNITKRFPGILANDNVNLKLYPGEIHALLGENGAGKSSLMNILTGIYKPNEGTILYRGKPITLNSPRNAIDIEIGMVHQHFRLVPPLTVTENIFLGNEACKYFLSQREMRQAISTCCCEFNLDVDPAAQVWQLSVGEQQRVEIVKLLFRGARILILDEPTAILTPQETRSLFAILRKMAEKGKSVVFITHKMYEVMAFADRITVLRGGKSINTLLRKDTTRDELAQMAIGRSLQITPDRRKSECGECVLALQSVNVLNDKNLPALCDVSFEAYRGEILGIAGVAGNGQRELAEAIAGLRKVQSGSIKLRSKEIANHHPKEIINSGLSFVPEDRLGMGLVPKLNIMENVILKEYNKEKFSRGGILKKPAIKEAAEHIVKKYDIKTTGIQRPVSLMSGGNQQKLLVGREVSGKPDLMLAAYPVRGLDVGATETIHNILREQRDSGTAVIMISEDLEHLFELSDRIAVMYEGQIMDIVKINEIGQESYDLVGRLMMGIKEGGPFHEDANMDATNGEDVLRA